MPIHRSDSRVRHISTVASVAERFLADERRGKLSSAAGERASAVSRESAATNATTTRFLRPVSPNIGGPDQPHTTCSQYRPAEIDPRRFRRRCTYAYRRVGNTRGDRQFADGLPRACCKSPPSPGGRGESRIDFSREYSRVTSGLTPFLDV